MHTVTFADVSGRTVVTIRSKFASRSDRDQALNAGMKHGMGQSMDRFEHLIFGMKAGSIEEPKVARAP